MAETATVEQVNGTVTETQERTFTQEEVNAIVENRVRKESAKYADYEELQKKASKLDQIEEDSKSELQKATEKAEALQKQIDDLTRAKELNDIRTKVSNETGVPSTLLSAETEELCKAQADAILEFAKSKNSYPSVKDAGEIQNVTTKKDAKDQFADWFNSTLNN